MICLTCNDGTFLLCARCGEKGCAHTMTRGGYVCFACHAEEASKLSRSKICAPCVALLLNAPDAGAAGRLDVTACRSCGVETCQHTRFAGYCREHAPPAESIEEFKAKLEAAHAARRGS